MLFPYLIRDSEFFIFDVGIVIIDLKTPVYSFLCDLNEKRRI